MMTQAPFNPEISKLQYRSHRSSSGKSLILDLAQLRMTVFREFPYLYEGSFEYEQKYLDRYFSAQNSFVFTVWDDDRLVGATTAILLSEEDEMICKAFRDWGRYPLDQIVYFGESILLKPYRGFGLGKLFFEERERFARSITSVKFTSFCAVVRDPQKYAPPADYQSPEGLWKKMGYKTVPELQTEMEWQEIGESESTPKPMQFWIKSLTQPSSTQNR